MLLRTATLIALAKMRELVFWQQYSMFSCPALFLPKEKETMKESIRRKEKKNERSDKNMDSKIFRYCGPTQKFFWSERNYVKFLQCFKKVLELVER